jgi:hypothetical protein
MPPSSSAGRATIWKIRVLLVKTVFIQSPAVRWCTTLLIPGRDAARSTNVQTAIFARGVLNRDVRLAEEAKTLVARRRAES